MMLVWVCQGSVEPQTKMKSVDMSKVQAGYTACFKLTHVIVPFFILIGRFFTDSHETL